MGRWFAALLLAAMVPAWPPALATGNWMSQEAMRAELIGKTIDGHYRSGLNWRITIFEDGRFEHYHERVHKIPGRWFFRGTVVCSSPEPSSWHYTIGCWSVIKVGANCYEYFRVRVLGEEPIEDASRDAMWSARGWRQDEPATCEQAPPIT
jgi:hypothetical protein